MEIHTFSIHTLYSKTYQNTLLQYTYPLLENLLYRAKYLLKNIASASTTSAQKHLGIHSSRIHILGSKTY
jgi:hypothetical protein